MPSERGNEKALWKWANHLHRAFLLFLPNFSASAGRAAAAEDGWLGAWRSSVGSTHRTSRHKWWKRQPGRAANRRAAVPHFAEKGSEGPPKQSKAGVLHHAGFCMDSFCFLDGVFPKRRCSCAFAEVASASALAERSTLRGVGVPVCTAAGFSSESGGIRPAPFSAFRFCFGLPALRLLADFGCAARRIFRRVSGKG